MAQSKHAKVTMTKNEVEKLLSGLRSLEAEKVLVGIPADKSGRNNADGSPLNNATIGAIMEHGSPAANIPARPWLRPGIASAKAKIIKRYEGAAKKAVKGDLSAATIVHQVVGQETADAVKKYIRTASFVPLKRSTIAARARQRGSMHRRKGEKYYLELTKGRKGGFGLLNPYLTSLGGGDAANIDLQAAAGIKPLINTGQLLNSVGYVVVKTGQGAPGGSADGYNQPTGTTGSSLSGVSPSGLGKLAEGAAAEGAEIAEVAAGVAEGAAAAAAVVAI